MTYCCAMLLDEGLVMASDSRTNAGVDRVSTFRKMFLFEKPGERIMALVTAGCFSTFAVIVRSNRHVNMLPALLMSGLFIAVVAIVAAIDRLGITLHDLALCFLWGGVMSGVGNGMFIIASRHLVAAELTLFMLLEFALAPLWVWMFIGETPNAALNFFCSRAGDQPAIPARAVRVRRSSAWARM